jgi:hypothetical protein
MGMFSFDPPPFVFRIPILDRFKLHSPSWVKEQIISHAWHPVHLSGFITSALIIDLSPLFLENWLLVTV